MTIKELERERLRDWFSEKHNWIIYKQVEREMYIKHYKKYSLLRRLSFVWLGIPESDRLWLIKETKWRIDKLWDDLIKEGVKE